MTLLVTSFPPAARVYGNEHLPRVPRLGNWWIGLLSIATDRPSSVRLRLEGGSPGARQVDQRVLAVALAPVTGQTGHGWSPRTPSRGPAEGRCQRTKLALSAWGRQLASFIRVTY